MAAKGRNSYSMPNADRVKDGLSVCKSQKNSRLPLWCPRAAYALRNRATSRSSEWNSSPLPFAVFDGDREVSRFGDACPSDDPKFLPFFGTAFGEWTARGNACIVTNADVLRTGGHQMPLFDGTEGMDDIFEIVERMEANCPRPRSTSRALWRLRHETNIGERNRSSELMLERAVAMLAVRGHMPGWFNQCPAASGIGDSAKNRKSSVDLVHWDEEERRLSLVELKWRSNTPTDAVRQILRYGAAYLFCRLHRDTLPVGSRQAMTARHVVLQVTAPARYFAFADEALGNCLARARESVDHVCGRLQLPGLAMSLEVLAFPEWFDRVPFTDGAETRDFCDCAELTETGRAIVDAFGGLASATANADPVDV